MTASADSPAHDASPTLDAGEVAQFARLAEDWWDETGPFRPLHHLNPTRLTYIRDRLCAQFGRDPKEPPCLEGLEVLDIGCGGGLVAEPLTRLGATVTGIDPGPETIAAAKAHAAGAGLTIRYETATAEALVDQGRRYDAVLLLEVVEHVPDVPAFLKRLAPLVAEGGIMILSTLNRTLKSYALAIVGAEYVLRWVPAGTHQWDRFVTPEELEASLTGAGLQPAGLTGMVYDPLADSWNLSRDTAVNYFLTATRPSA
ncbi:bifunctional 3-demethylubiquinol 3-O-methyltransferase/2-polyprenyl-6-hydroxyphenol methylase [Methyloceanibacter methanicus]|uniref:Ubiquinone biosynthesis O-methyltransferase n=1 Tax=Methyloceanibacter methanicus TaxID=1774968 RepID=A0A1E3W0K4_9HYPH|nr:bifunctional 2-polyprenyl-6-hydroxyphenol methylase/3-demethylubiquinol 3-O-methyltransferase UbiG [Methyloceanibacter methanicus]ODR99327.1 bifunctional 3-demethylubiquinol 3-O-methyltransferase/2-polyprenyl-6-hydroxyphenol methylase [Methyloceanibacter methanicus]